MRDQHGQPLPDETIQFGVTEGEARLSGRYLVENVTTDANGRAELTLSLGPNAETSIVRVSAPPVPECQPVFFTAMGVGASAVTAMQGDAHTWHVPDGVIARLGFGRIGASDRAVSFSPDGQHLAVASGIGIWMYDTATSRARTLLPMPSPVQSVAFSRDGTLLAAGARDASVSLWDVASGNRIFTLSGHRHSVTSVAFSPDGALLASGSTLQVVKLWDLATRRDVATWETRRQSHRLSPVSVAFSPDGKTLAAGDPAGIVLWNVASVSAASAALGDAEGSSAGVVYGDTATDHFISTPLSYQWAWSAAFSPDGKTLASGSDDGTATLWDASTLARLATLQASSGGRMRVSFSVDGKMLCQCRRGAGNTAVGRGGAYHPSNSRARL